MGAHGIGKIVGQEKNITTYNLARMNMLLHGVKDSEFEIYHGDTLTNDWDMLREMNPAKVPKFDAVVACVPSRRCCHRGGRAESRNGSCAASAFQTRWCPPGSAHTTPPAACGGRLRPAWDSPEIGRASCMEKLLY